jgi:hypothetical protein
MLFKLFHKYLISYVRNYWITDLTGFENPYKKNSLNSNSKVAKVNAFIILYKKKFYCTPQLC